MQNVISFVKSNKIASALVAGLVVSNVVAFGTKANVPSTVTNPTAPVASTYAPPVALTKSKMVGVVKADSASYYGNNATITTTVEVDDYFNYGFSGAEGSHYSFQVNGSGFEWLHAYGSRSQFKDLFDYIVENGGEARVKVTITTSPEHGDNGIWSLVGWEKA